MAEQYSIINIQDLMGVNTSLNIGEKDLNDLLSDFSCPKNPQVEYFLHHNAIEFAKKGQSITYLVFDNENTNLVGYFSLTIKQISIPEKKRYQ